jgi:hypothetical protein
MTAKIKLAKPGPRGGGDPLGQAQDMIYDAWEIADPVKRVSMARKALKISPDCADAYVLLAEIATTPAQALYRRGVVVGESALGKRTFVEHVGDFWGLLETRRYMRARAGLALSPWACNQRDEAIAHRRATLTLNPNDNQGVRFVIAARLLEADRDRELAASLKQHEDEGGASLIWASALLVFCTLGDGAKSRRVLADALASNPHEPTYLLGYKPLPQELPDYAGFSDGSEAMCLAADNLKAWQTTQGALAWLAHNIVPAKPTLLN